MYCRDCNMTIRVLMRYLATKLGLGDESQVHLKLLLSLPFFIFSLFFFKKIL